ncbi:MAG: hypothetical protein QM702_11940 [Rubrivivax sp.]
MKPEEKPSRRNRVERKEPPAPWWVKHAKENPFKTAGAVVTVVGSLILLAFFCQLGESPDYDLASFGAVPMAIAVVGAVLSAALTGCAFIAGMIHRGHKKGLAWLSPGWTVIFLMAPGLVGSIALAICMGIDPNIKLPTWTVWTPFGLLGLASLVVALIHPKSEAAPSVQAARKRARLRRFGELAGFGSVWVLAGYLALLTFWAVFPRDRSSVDFGLGLVFWIMCCYALNLMVAWAPRNVFVLLLATIPLGTLGLLSSTGNWAAIPKAIVSALGLGEIPVKLSVTKDGCEYLNKAAGDRVVCRMSPGDKTATVCPAMLRSRIGSPFFIGLSAYDDDGRWPQLHPPKRLEAISVPKVDAPSWTQLSRAMPKGPASAASGVIVTYLDSGDQGAWLREQCGASPDGGATVAASPASGAASAVAGKPAH